MNPLSTKTRNHFEELLRFYCCLNKNILHSRPNRAESCSYARTAKAPFAAGTLGDLIKQMEHIFGAEE